MPACAGMMSKDIVSMSSGLRRSGEHEVFRKGRKGRIERSCAQRDLAKSAPCRYIWPS